MVAPRRRVIVAAALSLAPPTGPAAAAAPGATGTFLDRSESDLRVATFNVNSDSIFSLVNPGPAPPVPSGWNVFKAGSLAIASRWPLARRADNVAPAGCNRVMGGMVTCGTTFISSTST